MSALADSFPLELNHLILHFDTNTSDYEHFLMLTTLKLVSKFTLQLVTHIVKQIDEKLAFKIIDQATKNNNLGVCLLVGRDILENTLSPSCGVLKHLLSWRHGIRGEKWWTPREKYNQIKNMYKDCQIKTCHDVGVCTFKITSKRLYQQVWYGCDTCWPESKNKGCCESCMNVCHKGHKIEEYKYPCGTLNKSKYGHFYCDCGCDDAKFPCLCVRKDLPSYFCKDLTTLWSSHQKFNSCSP